MIESEGESSDSSCDFLVPADKINLNSSFFKQKLISKPNLKTRINIESSDSDEEELEDFKPEDVDNAESAQLFSQILSNLENEKNLENLRKQNSSYQSDTKDDSKYESPKSRGLANEINQLLLRGETSAASSSFEKHVGEEEEEEEEDEKPETSSKYTIPKEGVLVTLPGTHVLLERKKKKTDLETLLRNKLNQRVRTTQVLIHKVGLLWWLVYGFHLNRLANDPEILATCLSLISKNDYPKGRVDLVYLQRVTTWFNKIFPVVSKKEEEEERILTTTSLLERIREKKIYNYRELVILFVALLRAIGLNCRLVVSLGPPALKPKRDQLLQVKKEEEVEKEEKEKESKSKKGKGQGKKGVNIKSKSKSKKPEKQEGAKKTIVDNSPEGRKLAQNEARKRAAAVLKKGKTEEKTKSDSNAKSDPKENSTVSRNLRQRPAKELVIETSSDDDFIPTKTKSKVIEPKVTQKHRKLISSDEESKDEKKTGQDVWVEVYIESENSWISVTISTSKINCVKEIYRKASDPVLYIVAYNSEGKIKDVTRRYCPNWLTVTRKQRVDEKWWIESLKPWKEKETAISKAEDEMLLKRELEQPLPKSMSECKGHPLYVLVRHLLKFEALYPPDAVPLGYLKNGEGIYSRYCVHTLRSRETWVKHARVVKPAEEAYKVVKSMPKYDKFSGSKIKGLPLDLFGRWQTSPYIPPEAKDGIVPRNEYGNVDLFQMSMLPKGTVYINLPALNRVAKKLNIDCSPAVVGFNFSGRGAVPAFEGFVVCEEFEDTLRDAWEAEQMEAAKRTEEKREKRIYGNWRKLINGLLIRLRLAAKYSADQNEESDSDSEQIAIIRNKLQSKRKNKSEKESVQKKRKSTEQEEILEKVPTKKETKSKAKGKAISEETATTSKRPTRKIARKQVYDDESSDSDSDFEVKKPKKETRSQKRKV